MPLPTYWTGDVPKGCQMTGRKFDGVMYDARLPGGSWGLICQATFDDYNLSLGVGRGQKFELQPNGKWLCTAGSAAHAVQLSDADRNAIRDEAQARKAG